MNTRWIKWVLNKYGTDILTGMAIGGVGLTGWLGVQAGKKATLQLHDKGLADYVEPKREFETTWKCYIPPFASAVVTTAFIIAADRVHLHNEAVLAGVAAMCSTKYRDLEKAVNGLVEPEKLKEIKEAVYADEKRPPWLPAPKSPDEKIYYEPYSKQYFTATPHAMTYAQLYINKTLQEYKGATLNDYLNVLPGCKRIPEGNPIGWYMGTNGWEEYWAEFDGSHFIDLHFEERPDGAQEIVYDVTPSLPDDDWEPWQ